MRLNPPVRIRRLIYVITTIGTPLVAYLNAKGIIGDLEVALWSAEVAAAGIMAGINSTETEIQPVDDEV